MAYSTLCLQYGMDTIGTMYHEAWLVACQKLFTVTKCQQVYLLNMTASGFFSKYCEKKEIVGIFNIRESVDSLCREGPDMQYMQYLSKSRIASPQTRQKLI